jgi:2-hydroxychromene-2-carboxylate isomerase
MSADIDFYFDFPSAYSYIAAEKIDALAAANGSTVRWHAISLPHVFKALQYPPPLTQPAKWAYAMHDWHRSCDQAGLPHVAPADMPLDARRARVAFWSLEAEDPARARQFARRVIGAYWGRGRDVHSAVDLAAASGLPAQEIERRAADGDARHRLVAETTRALEAGVFGAPFFIAGGEPFWGADRLDQLAAHLRKGNA